MAYQRPGQPPAGASGQAQDTSQGLSLVNGARSRALIGQLLIACPQLLSVIITEKTNYPELLQNS